MACINPRQAPRDALNVVVGVPIKDLLRLVQFRHTGTQQHSGTYPQSQAPEAELKGTEQGEDDGLPNTNEEFFEQSVPYYLQGDATPVYVHPSKFCWRPNLLRTKFYDNSNTLPLDRNWRTAFLTYVKWLESGQFDIWHDDDLCTAAWHPACFSVDRLVHACIVGQKLKDVAYRNATVDELMRTCVEHGVYPNLHIVKRYWSSLPAGCGMKLAIAELLGRHASGTDLNTHADSLPQELKDKILMMIIRDRNLSDRQELPGDKDPRYYHESEGSGDDWDR